MGKEALVVPRKILFKGGEFQGFLGLEKGDFVSIVMGNYSYCERGEELEHDEELKQIIPYIWIVNLETRRVFLYKRGFNANKQDGEFREERYMHKYSGGVGGHIDRDTEEGADDPVIQAMLRELREEVDMVNYLVPKIVGYINDDSDDIGKVHFGVVSIAETTGSVKARDEEGLSFGDFYSVEGVEKIFNSPENEVENWTRISWPFVRDYLEKL